MYRLIRPLLFQMDPETAHGLTLQLISLAGRLRPAGWLLQAMFRTKDKPVEAFGLLFRNPVGLAAGYDKDGIAISGLAALGFGHLEIGTVTPQAQEGNPKPRVFRLVEDEAVINRMGFPGRGMEAVARELRGRGGAGRGIIVGVNLGKNKDTPLEKAAEDYQALLRRFHPLADYLTINISSPNTAGLRRLQGREMLEELLGAISEAREEIRAGGGGRKPVLVKLAPDLDKDELEDAVGVIVEKRMDGLIATNTTLGREGLRSRQMGESGGLSGSPLRVRSEEILREVVRLLDGRLPVISVGGIMTPEDAKRRLEMGAALIQVYTGLVYAGPGLVREILREL